MIVYLDCSPFMYELLAECSLSSPDEFRVHLGDPEPGAIPGLLAEATVLMNGHTQVDAALLARCPRLKSIVFLGTGAGSYIDLEAAEAAGVTVRTIKGYGDRSIAEHAFALALAAARQLATMDRELRAGLWEPRDGVELAGRCFGVVGAGGVGREIARIAKGFGMEVLIWNRSPLPDELAASAAPLDLLLARSDIVSLHLAETAETRGFAGQDFFAAMKMGALFVNTARGRLVDDPALIAALASGRVAHAALDVFAEEPIPGTSSYLGLKNVTLSAHAAFKTREASRRLLQSGLSAACEEASKSSVPKLSPRGLARS